MKSKKSQKLTSIVLAVAITVSLLSTNMTTAFASLGYWPEPLPISNEFYYENETLQPYGACFQVDELKNWSPDNDPDARYNRGAIPLQNRWMGPSVNTNASRDAKVMPLAMSNARASESASQGGDGDFAYAFTNFQYVDNYNFWGGSSGEGPIAIPSPEHIDSAHRNGVKATGTIFIPWGDSTYGSRFIQELVQQDADGNFVCADKLIEIAEYYGFDGYIINQESSSDTATMDKFKDMLEYIQLKKPNDFTMSWYNGSGSLNTSSCKNWMQDDKNRINDDWWLDMSWGGIDNTIAAAQSVERSPFDVHATWEYFPISSGSKGGSVSSLVGEDQKLKCSLGILAPTVTLTQSANSDDFQNVQDQKLWTGPTFDPRNTERKDSVFCGFSSLIADRTPIIGSEFVTNFTTGNGYKFYENGVATGKSAKGWYNRSLTDVMPTWRWIVESEGKKLSPKIDYDTAWWGGTSLKVEGALDANKANHIKLYSSQLDITAQSKLSITYKTPTSGVDMSVGLCFGNNYDNDNFKFYPIETTADGQWTTKTVDLSADAGKKAIAISLKFNAATDVSDYSMNIGRMAFTTNTTAPAATSSITLDESIYLNDTTAEARIYWEKAENAALYEIHRVHPDGTREFIGATPNDAFYLGKLIKDGAETNFDFEITSYSSNGTKGGVKTLNFKWPAESKGFEAEMKAGSNIALKAPAVTDTECAADGPVDKLTDGVIPSSKWCGSSDSGSAYLDLGKNYDISRWVVYHANSRGAGEGVDFNTVEFDLQYAADDSQPKLDPNNSESASRVQGLNYTVADTVTNNKQDVTDRVLSAPIQARYIKLHVSKSCSCPWTAIRIYEFELYENAYVPHSTPLLDRNVTVKNKAGATDTAVFNNVPMPVGANNTISENTGLVKLYNSLGATEPIAQVKATQPNETYNQRHKGVATFTGLNLNTEGGRLYYTTQENDMISPRYSVKYAPETGEAIPTPVINLVRSLKGNQTRDNYGILTLTGLPEGTEMKVYESADSSSPILHSRPVQPGTDYIKQTRIPLKKDGGKIYYELKLSGRPDSARLEFVYPAPTTLRVDQNSLKEMVERFDNRTENDYTAATWAPFKEAFGSAKALLIKDNVTVAEAETARVALAKTGCGLRKVADVTRIKEIYNEYLPKYVEKDYTVNSFKAYKDSMDAVNSLITGVETNTNACDNFAIEQAGIALNKAVLMLSPKADITVTNVDITPATVTVAKGKSVTFKATVVGTGDPDQNVTWKLTGTSNSATTLTNGLLTIASDETAPTLTITATSVVDPTKSGTATVTIGQPAIPGVTKVAITPKTATVKKGTIKQFTAAVTADNGVDIAVTWTVEGAKDPATILANGLLSIAPNEAATSLTIKATSNADKTKSDIATVNVSSGDPTAFTITVDTIANGKVIADKVTAVAGETVTLTVAPNKGYQLKAGTLKFNKTVVTGTKFTMPAGNVTITSEFEKIPVTPPVNPPVHPPVHPPVTPPVTPPVNPPVADFNVKGEHEFKITSTNGQIPALVIGTAGVFNTQLVRVSGNEYYFKFIAIGKPGAKAGIYLNGVKLSVATITAPVSTVKSDTNHPFEVNAGNDYTFKITADSKPTFVVGTSSAFKVDFVKAVGKDYFFKVTAIGKAGAASGFYINSEKTPVTVATISK